MEPITTSSQLLLIKAIDQVRQATEGPELSLDHLAKYVIDLLGPSLSLSQIGDAAEGLLHLAAHPGCQPAAQLVPTLDVEAVRETALALLDWQKQQQGDNRSDSQKLIDNAIDSNTVLVRDLSGSPELQEIAILELLQRYPCRGNDARWSPEDAIAFLESKALWLDAALEARVAEGEAMVDDSYLGAARAVIVVVPDQPEQPLRTEMITMPTPMEN